MKKFILLLLIISQYSFALNPGDKAPDFTLMNQAGKQIKLSELKNQIVVMEWYNDGCPFVRKHYDSGNMQMTQKTFANNDNVVWLSIVSSAKDKQGYLADAKEAAKKLKEEGSFADHMLLDFDGKVGQAYDAKTTPHIFITDFKGIIQYAGAIDSVASTDSDDIKGAKNYALSAVSKLLLQSKPSPAKTKAYGCSVKY